MKKYTFVGAVLSHGKILGNDVLETMAPTKEKAIANIKYQFRKKNNIVSAIPLTLAGKVVES